MASTSIGSNASTSDEKNENEIKDEITPDDEDERMWAALSFVIILIVIGVPLWWKMTEVERSYFPYNEISDLRLQNVSFPFNISIRTLNPTFAEQIETNLSKLFSSSDLFQANFEINAIPKDFRSQTINDLEANPDFHPNEANFLQLVEAVFASSSNLIIGKHRTVYIKKDTSASEIFVFLQEIVLHENLLKESIKAVTHPGYTSENLNYLRKMRPNPKYDIIFTVVNPEPEHIKFEWNNEIILERSFRPFLDQLNNLSEFKIKSQWLYLVHLQQVPKKVDDHFELNQKQIPHIITPLEKKIGSGVAKNPCINFVLYVTKCEHAPMVFIDERNKPTSAVLSARWGGVQLVNPNSTHCLEKQPFKTNAKKVMKIFLAQFKTLLGLSDFSLSPKVIRSEKEMHIYPWEMDGLYRMRILEQFTSSRITLTSLSQLLGEISNIVITDEVGNAVLEAVNTAKETLKMLENGLLVEALNFSTRSFISSEFAFTHPSLLALLYFPDDQKYAVYIPLYLPVMIPVLLSLKNIQNWLKKKFIKEKED